MLCRSFFDSVPTHASVQKMTSLFLTLNTCDTVVSHLLGQVSARDCKITSSIRMEIAANAQHCCVGKHKRKSNYSEGRIIVYFRAVIYFITSPPPLLSLLTTLILLQHRSQN